MSNVNIDPESFWRNIEESGAPSKKEKVKKDDKPIWENPLQEKYAELLKRYDTEYPHPRNKMVEYDVEYNRLLEDLRSFENVFRIMNWNKKP
jgi:hypothetical protein